MTAEDDYPAHGSIQGPAELTNEQYIAMCDEIDRLRATDLASPCHTEPSRTPPNHGVPHLDAAYHTLTSANVAVAAYPLPLVDHENQRVTFVVTFDWDRNGLHMDHCEVGVLAGDLHRLLVDHYRSWEQLKAVHPVRTYEPLEERHIGSVQRTVQLHG